MEVSPTGQGPAQVVTGQDNPIALLHYMVNLQHQSLELQKQSLEMQRQQLELARENSQISREQRTRQGAELERWQNSHENVLDQCKESLTNLEQVHAALMAELAEYVSE